MHSSGYLVPAALLFSSLGWAATTDGDLGRRIVMQGNEKGVVACGTCHGPDGGGNAKAGFPRLSNLAPGYLAKQLRDYQSGARQNPIMQPFAKSLSPEEQHAVSQYYAAQTSGGDQSEAAGKATLAKGKRLAEQGDWEKNVPACVTCHGPGGRGVGDAFPALAGQHASYIKAQLEAWRSGTRHNDPNNLMKTVADRLSKDEINAVSKYFASLPAGY